MGLLAPLALLGLLFLPAILAMYLLRLRRKETIVASTLLWQGLVADVEANAPWQRLRRSLLLLVQLLLAVLLVFLAARPVVERPAGLARDLVLVVDVSASMAATDVRPNRLAAAKEAAIAALADLPAGGTVSVIAAGRTARIVANATTDLGRVRAAIAGLEPAPERGDLGDALRLAAALAARSGDAEILVATDAAGPVPEVRLEIPVRVLPVGRGRDNQAIAALAVRSTPSGVGRSLFVSIVNTDLEAAERRLVVSADGIPIEARDVFLDPQTRTEIVVDDLPEGIGSVEVALLGRDGDAGRPADNLALDDRAWAVVPPVRLRRILLVSEGDPYLETALSYLPGTELYGIRPADYGPATHPELFDLIIFESTLPATLPSRPILAIAPPRSSPLGEVVGTLTEPGIGRLDPGEPLLRYVDLSTVHIAEAKRLVLPDWARVVVPGPEGAPLLYAGSRLGLPTAVLAFEPRRSDLPLQVAFPILVANLAGELMGGGEPPSEPLAPGDPVELTIPEGATGLRIERPDGIVHELVPGTPEARTVTYAATELLGVYTVRPIAAGSSAASPTPTTGPSPTPTAGGSPGTGGSSPSPVPADPTAPGRFAVDLLDVGESTIAPGSPASLEALGRRIGGAGTAPDRPPARDEIWPWLALLALLGLLVEWIVYERDGLARLRRSVANRLERVTAGSAVRGGAAADRSGTRGGGHR
ncbi:MAG TPA: VWA domain-containing protein [Candidatus Binatia bacterium]|nr:VWA domain-containing protein [Candidatus Binatia bacterium]